MRDTKFSRSTVVNGQDFLKIEYGYGTKFRRCACRSLMYRYSYSIASSQVRLYFEVHVQADNDMGTGTVLTFSPEAVY